MLSSGGLVPIQQPTYRVHKTQCDDMLVFWVQARDIKDQDRDEMLASPAETTQRLRRSNFEKRPRQDVWVGLET